MKKLEVSDAEIMRLAIQEELIRSEESRYDHRLHGVLLVSSGYSCYEVADIFGHSPRTVESWIQRFEKSGFAGLFDQQRPGRPAALDNAVRTSLGKDLRRSPRELGYAQNFWDGRLLSHHLARVYNVHIGIRHCQRLFHQLGFRRRKPRPVIASADPQAQKQYKKTRPHGPQR